MSFILDALRKSEATRRRSEAPDLFAAMPATPELARARPNWPLWLLGAVAAFSLIAVLWLLAQRAREAPTASAPTSPTVDASAETGPSNDAAASDPALEPITVPIPPQPRPPVDPASPAAAAGTSPQPAAPLAAAPLPPPPRELPAPPPIAIAAAPILPLALPPTGRVVSLADLDPATRKLLPPLKLSMHLWNDAPAQRFVILDGQRLREGDLLGELVIERITREGAVLAWRGGQLRIELR